MSKNTKKQEKICTNDICVPPCTNCNDLKAEIEHLRNVIKLKNNCIEKCMWQFTYYVGCHTMNKKQEKAQINEVFAHDCEDALKLINSYDEYTYREED